MLQSEGRKYVLVLESVCQSVVVCLGLGVVGVSVTRSHGKLVVARRTLVMG